MCANGRWKPFESSRKREKKTHLHTPEQAVLLTRSEQANGEGLAATAQVSQDGSALVSPLTQLCTKHAEN